MEVMEVEPTAGALDRHGRGAAGGGGEQRVDADEARVRDVPSAVQRARVEGQPGVGENHRADRSVHARVSLHLAFQHEARCELHIASRWWPACLASCD